MNKFTFIRNAVVAASLSMPALLFAGNVPQYSFSTNQNYFSQLKNPISCGMDFSKITTKPCAVFENGSMVQEAQTGKGFPIGFNFRFAGRVVDQFVPASNGVIFFGKDYVKLEAEPDLALKTGDHMGYVNMHAGFVPAEDGITSGDISYLTEGEEGNRITTVQFLNMTLDDTNWWGDTHATFNLQIRLYEKDNSIEMAWTELQHPAMMANLFAGIHGWEPSDGIIIGGNTLKADYAVSAKSSGDVTDPDARIYWETYNPNDDEIRTCFVFKPSTDDVAPMGAPGNLQVDQDGTDLIITCNRAVDAAATVILVSEEPITDANLPQDGETFGIRTFSKGNDYVTSFGKAKAIYYGNDNNVSVTYSGVKPSTTYYVKALSASGYPAYQRENTADEIVSAAKEAPANVSISPSNSALTLSWDSEVDVIVAMTTEPIANPSYPYYNGGDFGRPTAESKVGDTLEGGGEIVYVGADKECTVTVPKNEMVYFALWSKDGEIISREYSSVYGVTNPTLPYEPKLEKRNLNLIPAGWTSSDNLSYSVQRRANPDEWALYGTCEGDEPALESPLLPLEEDTELSFEFALETAADAGMTTGGDPAKGTVPGYFGHSEFDYVADDSNNGLFVKIGNEVVAHITDYEGDMTAEGEKFVKSTSEFVPVTVQIPAQGKKARIAISFSAYNNSVLWLRNFKLTSIKPDAIEGINDTIQFVYGGKGCLWLTASENGTRIYSVDGTLVAEVYGEAGELRSVDLRPGLYIVDGVKVLVK